MATFRPGWSRRKKWTEFGDDSADEFLGEYLGGWKLEQERLGYLVLPLNGKLCGATTRFRSPHPKMDIVLANLRESSDLIPRSSKGWTFRRQDWRGLPSSCQKRPTNNMLKFCATNAAKFEVWTGWDSSIHPFFIGRRKRPCFGSMDPLGPTWQSQIQVNKQAHRCMSGFQYVSIIIIIHNVKFSLSLP